MTEQQKNLPSLAGYVNWDELKQILLKGVGQTSMIGLSTMIVLVASESAQKWYVGPGAPMVIFVLTALASYLRSQSMAKRFIAEGEQP